MIFKVVLKDILWDASVEDLGDLFKGSSYSMNPLFGSTGNFLSVFKTFIYLFLATLGLCCCMQAFPSCGKWGLLLLWCMGFSLQWLLLWSTSSREIRIQ